MKNLKISLLALLLLGVTLASAQQVKKSTFGTFILKGGTIHTITNGVVEADLLIVDGKIRTIGNDLEIPEGATEVNCKGMSIYPGMIDSGTKLGLSEISSVSLTSDSDALGDFTPHAQALTAVNPNSVLIPVTRVNGVTTVLSMPTRGLFPGTAALINLHGYTPEQMYAGFKGVILNFPSSGKRGRWDRRSEEEIKKDDVKAKKRLNEVWESAELYAKIHKDNNGKVDYNPAMESMHKVLLNEVPLLLEVNKEKDILAAIKWVEDKDVKVVFMGVREGWRVADSLAKSKIPVITGPILALPSRASDSYVMGYANASEMMKAGVKVAIRTNETENVRNLPFNAAYAANYGMGKEEAMKAVTINPAVIFGVDDQYGSLEEGKVASLYICDGDPFETKTKIFHLFIDGWKVPIESRHTLLYDEFIERNPGVDR